MDIERVDLRDAAVGDAWYAVYASADRHERPHATPWLRGEIADSYAPSLRADARAYAGVVDGRIVCVGTLRMPLLDNTHSAALEVFTDPDHRRRGYGSGMLTHLEEQVRLAGRRTAYLEVSYPIGSTPDSSGSAGTGFALSRGYTFGLGDIMRSLDLPVPVARLADLERETACQHHAYRLEAFAGRVPDIWVADYVRLDAQVAADAPSGTLEIEAGTTDVASFRELEERFARQDRITYSAVALLGEEVAGYTAISVVRSDRAQGYQWGTLVGEAHRGHRLGLGLKVANLRQIQTLEPDLRSIVTWNAEGNDQMVAVNDQLGFAPVERLAEFEKRW